MLKKAISHKISKNYNKLVFNTCDKSIENNDTEGIYFHSDIGFQYTNRSFQRKNSQIKNSSKYVFESFNYAKRGINKYIKFLIVIEFY